MWKRCLGASSLCPKNAIFIHLAPPFLLLQLHTVLLCACLCMRSLFIPAPPPFGRPVSISCPCSHIWSNGFWLPRDLMCDLMWWWLHLPGPTPRSGEVVGVWVCPCMIYALGEGVPSLVGAMDSSGRRRFRWKRNFVIRDHSHSCGGSANQVPENGPFPI